MVDLDERRKAAARHKAAKLMADMPDVADAVQAATAIATAEVQAHGGITDPKVLETYVKMLLSDPDALAVLRAEHEGPAR